MSENETNKPSRGLGRGLSALLGDSQNLNQGGPIEAAKELPIEFIRPNPQQPRRTFDQEELSGLAETIKEHGIIQPIVIRPDPTTPGHFSIIAGERRWRAAQIAGLHKVPVVVREFDELTTLKVAIVENLQRQDLNAIEEAVSFGQLMDRFGYNQQQIADTIGKSRAYVANTIRLLGLPKEVQEMVVHGVLSAGHARAALTAADPLSAAKEMVTRKLSVREAESLVNKQSMNREKVSRETESDNDALALADDLTANLGLPVEIKHKGEKGGTLTITYVSLEQLDELCRRLGS